MGGGPAQRMREQRQACRGPGWEGTETSEPLSLPHRPRMQACSPGPWGVPAVAGLGLRCWGAWWRRQAGVQSQVVWLKYSMHSQRRGVAAWPDRHFRAKGRHSKREA